MSVPVVGRHRETGDRHLDALTWGLVPSFTKDLKAARKPINARAETLSASGLFRSALGRRRCLVPASAFYEWKTTPDGKVPHAIARADGELLAFAGLWESWHAPEGEGVLRTFAIITTKANQQMATLHNRMSVILEPAAWPAWLGEVDSDPQTMLGPAPGGILRIWPVDKRVGNVQNDGAELLKPHGPPEPAERAAEPAGPNPL